jgi:hypothetical protein
MLYDAGPDPSGERGELDIRLPAGPAPSPSAAVRILWESSFPTERQSGLKKLSRLERRIVIYTAHIESRNWRREEDPELAELWDWWPGSVYFVQSVDGGPIKIGFTSRKPEARLSELQKSSPSRLRLLAVIPDADSGLERMIHSDFDDERLHSEWFEPNELLGEVIDHYAVA